MPLRTFLMHDYSTCSTAAPVCVTTLRSLRQSPIDQTWLSFLLYAHMPPQYPVIVIYAILFLYDAHASPIANLMSQSSITSTVVLESFNERGTDKHTQMGKVNLPITVQLFREQFCNGKYSNYTRVARPLLYEIDCAVLQWLRRRLVVRRLRRRLAIAVVVVQR